KFSILLLVEPPPSPASALFPYTTLFRSGWQRRGGKEHHGAHPSGAPLPLGRPPPRRPHHHGRLPLPEPDPGRARAHAPQGVSGRSEEHTSELQSRENLVCRLLLEKKKTL